MATITKRRRADGSQAYRAAVRIRRQGKIVYQEARTFDRQRLASAWARQRELELQQPGALDRVRLRGVTVGALIQRYLDEISAVKPFGRSKAANLKLLLRSDLAERDALQLRASDLIDHVRERQAGGAGPATINNDLVWLRTVFKTARPLWDVPVDLQVVEDAAVQLRTLGWTARAARRQRRPTDDELERLLAFFASRDQRAAIPMCDLVRFALCSARRQAEITRLRWADLNETDRTGLVEDLKHPRHKRGNHQRFKLLREGWEIVQRQPRRSEFVFPYNPKSVGTAFTRACQRLAIDDLRFHDLRHEATSRLFEKGYSIQEVQQFTLHEDWNTLRRYTHLRPGDIQER